MAPRTIFNTESVSILLKHCREVLGQLEGAKGAFVWLVDTWGQGGDEDQVNNWSLHILTSKQVIGVAAQQFRDFLHVFGLCGGQEGQSGADGTRGLLERAASAALLRVQVDGDVR